MTTNDQVIVLREAAKNVQDKLQSYSDGQQYGGTFAFLGASLDDVRESVNELIRAIPATERAATQPSPKPAGIFDGYVDGKPRIQWTGEALPVGTKLYAAPISEDTDAHTAAISKSDAYTLRRVIECCEELNKRPRPMCRDCADENGTCPNGGLECDMRKLFADARVLMVRLTTAGAA